MSSHVLIWLRWRNSAHTEIAIADSDNSPLCAIAHLTNIFLIIALSFLDRAFCFLAIFFFLFDNCLIVAHHHHRCFAGDISPFSSFSDIATKFFAISKDNRLPRLPCIKALICACEQPTKFAISYCENPASVSGLIISCHFVIFIHRNNFCALYNICD